MDIEVQAPIPPASKSPLHPQVPRFQADPSPPQGWNTRPPFSKLSFSVVSGRASHSLHILLVGAVALFFTPLAATAPHVLSQPSHRQHPTAQVSQGHGEERIWSHPTWIRTVLRLGPGISPASQWQLTPTHCPWKLCSYHNSTKTKMGTLPRLTVSWATTCCRVGIWGWWALGGRMRGTHPGGGACWVALSRQRLRQPCLGNVWRSPVQPCGDDGPQLSAMPHLAGPTEPSQLPVTS